MVKYSCERCGKEFAQKSRYTSHQKRKTPCENDVEKINEDSIKLPNTRFQGSKKKIIDKIFDIMMANIRPQNILDLFGGSSICSLYFQMNDINVVYNDVLKCNCINSYGFLNNDLKNIPTEKDIQNIFIKKKGITYETFISKKFKDIYYTPEENLQLDIFNGNINMYATVKRNIMYYLLFQSLLSKRPYNLFHRKNLHMRLADVKRSFGNKGENICGAYAKV